MKPCSSGRRLACLLTILPMLAVAAAAGLRLDAAWLSGTHAGVPGGVWIVLALLSSLVAIVLMTARSARPSASSRRDATAEDR